MNETLAELKKKLSDVHDVEEIDSEISNLEVRISELECERNQVIDKQEEVAAQIARATPEETEWLDYGEIEIDRQDRLLKQRYGYRPLAINDWWTR